MTMTKRFLSLALALALGTTLMAGCSKGDSSSADASGSSSAGASSASQIEPMDLTGITDPFLATAGLAGDTVVATAGERRASAMCIVSTSFV